MSESNIKLCKEIGSMVKSFNAGTLLQTKWGQGYAVIFLGMAHQMHSMVFLNWCGSGRGKGLAMEQVNTDVKNAISLRSSPQGDPETATIKYATLAVAWSLGVAAARDDASMGLTFFEPSGDSKDDSKGKIKVDLEKLTKWVNKGGILKRADDTPDPIKWKQARARTNALIKSLDELTVGDFPTDNGLPQLVEFNKLLDTLRAMDAMVNGIITPAVVDKKPATKKRATRKAA